MTMNVRWMSEACDLPAEPATGTYVTRLTATVMSNINIYCEQPYTTPDGNRIAILRSPYADPRMPPAEVCVIDLKTLRLAVIDQNVQSIFIATTGYSGIIHYLTSELMLARLNLATLDRELLFRWPLPATMCLDSATPDGRYLVGALPEDDGSTSIVRVDLRDGKFKKIYHHEDSLGHIQVNHVNGLDVLVQHNRGSNPRKGRKLNEDNIDPGATHFVIDLDGGSFRSLAIGEPHTSGTTGHTSWVAGTGRIGVSVAYHWRNVHTPGALDERFPEGNFLTVGPDDKKPIGFKTPGHRFNHVNVSRDGKYFVCDCYCQGLPGGIELVIGNIETGKHRVLLANCGAQGGGPACSHPHPYLTADNRRVIYNADPYGVCHVHAAHVTEEFLKSLE
ncbi:hypothetical protein HQ590_14750 [bacterium]|nr:hypothetical protein [bacterium]